MQRYIYGLADPDTDIIYYIGIATDVEKRVRSARRNQPLLQDWLKSIRPRKPKVILLDIIQSHENWKKIEAFHIRSHYDAGFPLINRWIPQEDYFTS